MSAKCINKKRVFFSLTAFFFILFSLLSLSFFLSQKTKQSVKLKKTLSNPPKQILALRKKSAAAEGKQTYTIMTPHHSPNFTKAIIDPEDVRLGEKQTMTVYISDDKAPITEVIAEIETDNGIIKHPLTLKSGTNRDGIWESSWNVKDTHDITYVTVFKAKNEIGETGETRLSWTDPGCSCTGQTCTVSTTCTVSGVDGADGGLLTISGGGITVAASTTLIAGSLSASGGYLNVNDTGTVNIGSTNTICMTDADSDNYPVNTTQIANCSSGRRRYLMTSITTVDCCDSNANAYPGQTSYYSTATGCGTGGGYDYNCDSSSTQQYTGLVTGGCSWNGEACVFGGGSEGWQNSVPACGVSGTWDPDGCGGNEDTCWDRTIARTQTCR